MNELSIDTYFDLNGYIHSSLFEGIEFPWEALEKIPTYFQGLGKGRILGEVDSRAYLIHPDRIWIDEKAVVEPGAYIKGPAYIGRGSVVRHGAYVRGNVIVGQSCVVGHDTEVKGSIFLNGAQAAHFAYVGDSILGSKVNLGAGTKLANLKLDGSDIIIRSKEKRIPTGRRKFGAILGDRVQLGCNSVTNPGTLMGKDSSCFPCVNARGMIPPKAVVTAKGVKR